MAREGNYFPVRVMQKIIAGLKLLGVSLLGLFFVLSFGLTNVQAAPNQSGAPSSASSAATPTTTTTSAPDVLLGLKQAGKAAYDGPPPVTDIAATISGLVTTIIGLIGVVFFLLLLYAGVLYMTSAGDGDKVDKAKKLITSAIIGIIIVFSAYALASFVEGVLKTPPRPTPYVAPQGVTTEELTDSLLDDATGDAGNGNFNAVLDSLSNPNYDCDLIRRNQTEVLNFMGTTYYANSSPEIQEATQQTFNSLGAAITECNLNTSARPPTTSRPPADTSTDCDLDPDNCDSDNPDNNPTNTFQWSWE